MSNVHTDRRLHDEFLAAVDNLVRAGRPRNQAVRDAALRMPEARMAFVRHANREAGRPVAEFS